MLTTVVQLFLWSVFIYVYLYNQYFIQEDFCRNVFIASFILTQENQIKKAAEELTKASRQHGYVIMKQASLIPEAC